MSRITLEIVHIGEQRDPISDSCIVALTGDEIAPRQSYVDGICSYAASLSDIGVRDISSLYG